MELEVGMYCFCKQRRNLGIGKILNISKYGNVFVQFKNYVKVFVNSDLKTSHNIIDLVEVGDYVNGYKIDYINLNCETPFLRSNQPYRVDNTLYSTLIEKGKDYNQPLHFYEADIKTILTKEVFKANEYRVETD